MREARSGGKSDRTGRKGKPYGASESFASASGKKIEKVCQMQKRAGFPRVSYWEGN